MKTISKEEANSCLDHAREAGWNWDDFHKNNQNGYWLVKEQALEEQHHECAYTGLWLGEGTTQTIHLDHFRKKGIYDSLTFDYGNLFAAAKDLPCGSDCKDRKIHGPRQHADAQYATFWSPCQQHLEHAFWYRQDGYMVPDDSLNEDEKEMARNTIDMYNLNCSDLVNRRARILRMMEDMRDCEEDLVRMSMSTVGFSFLVEFGLQHRGQ